MEADLHALLSTLCPRVHPDIREGALVAPWITYQAVGGTPWRYVDNQPAPERHTVMQINVWAHTRAEALTLIRAVEEAMCSASAFNARPVSEPISSVEDMSPRIYGSLQQFDIYSDR